MQQPRETIIIIFISIVLNITIITMVLNTTAMQADGGINTGEGGGMWPLAGEIKENNFANLEVAKQLVDPSFLDFRPVEGGSLTRGPEIIGPYQETTINFIIDGAQIEICWCYRLASSQATGSLADVYISPPGAIHTQFVTPITQL